MELAASEGLDERSDQDAVLSLSDERRGNGNDGFSTANAERDKDGSGELADDPLQNAEVEEGDAESDKEDDGGERVDEEEVILIDEIRRPEEAGTTADGIGFSGCLGLRQEVSSSECDPLEEGETGVGSEDEEGNGELKTHAEDRGSSLDRLVVGAECEETKVDEDIACQADGSLHSSRRLDLWETVGASEEEDCKACPTQSKPCAVRHPRPRLAEDGVPSAIDDTQDGPLRDVARVVQEDEQDEEPGDDGGWDPADADLRSVIDDGYDPPTEEQGEQDGISQVDGVL